MIHDYFKIIVLRNVMKVVDKLKFTMTVEL